MRGRESWLVSKPGELSLRKFFENTSGCERAQEAEAILLETGWVSNPSPLSDHFTDAVRKLLLIPPAGNNRSREREMQ